MSISKAASGRSGANELSKRASPTSLEEEMLENIPGRFEEYEVKIEGGGTYHAPSLSDVVTLLEDRVRKKVSREDKHLHYWPKSYSIKGSKALAVYGLQKDSEELETIVQIEW